MNYEIPFFVNNSVFKKHPKALNEIVKEENYERIYDLISVQADNSVGIIGREKIKEINSNTIDSIFDGTSIQKVVFPWGVNKTAIQSCRDCVNLNTAIIPDTVEEISNHTFYGCDSLKTVKLPDSLKTIGRGAFADSELTYIKIPESVTSIDSTAFQNCPNLTAIDVEFSEGDVTGAPWGATNATINYI